MSQFSWCGLFERGTARLKAWSFRSNRLQVEGLGDKERRESLNHQSLSTWARAEQVVKVQGKRLCIRFRLKSESGDQRVSENSATGEEETLIQRGILSGYVKQNQTYVYKCFGKGTLVALLRKLSIRRAGNSFHPAMVKGAMERV